MDGRPATAAHSAALFPPTRRFGSVFARPASGKSTARSGRDLSARTYYSRAVADGSILSDAQFRKLVRDLKKLLTDIDSNAKKPVANALVGAYWRVGERIVSEGLAEAAGYGEAVLERLAEGLDIHRRTLQRSIVFFQEYHRAPSAGLSWAHYRELLTISDPDERSFYEQLAIERGLSRDKTNAAIRGRLFEKEHTGKPSKPKLERPSDRRYRYSPIISSNDFAVRIWSVQRSSSARDALSTR